MATTSQPAATPPTSGVPAKQVYVMAVLCLVLGFSVGFFFPGKRSGSSGAALQSSGTPSQAPSSYSGLHPHLTIEQMKQMADMKAATLIEKTKADPKNASLLIQIADIYQASHQFKEAAGYFDRALKIDPKNVSARTNLASCIYYSGDVDGALSQLDQALKYNPKDANSLFNLGMIRYQGKKDSAGAIAAWKELLKTNPNLDRKPIVEKMIAEAKGTSDGKN